MFALQFNIDHQPFRCPIHRASVSREGWECNPSDVQVFYWVITEDMKLTIAAIRSGTEPMGKLPEGAFHRWLDDPINCPKCEATYNLVAPWDDAVSKFFPDESRPLITLLRKAVLLGHANNHRITHFETSGVVVRSVVAISKK